MAKAEIVASLKDGVSRPMADMTRANGQFNSSLADTNRAASQYSSRLSSLRTEQSRLQTELESSKKALNDAKAAFKQTGSAADQESLQAAYQHYNDLKDSLKDVTQAAGETRRALRDVNAEGSSPSASGAMPTDGGSMVSQMATAGAFAMVGEVAAQAVGQYATSALGASGGNYVSSAISTAGMGAAIGTAIAPGIGTAIGAVLGGGIGLITAKMDELAAKDDYYKEAVQNNYDTLTAQQADILSSGSTLAASRETTRTSYISLLGGSESDADNLMTGLLDFSNSTPYLFDDLSSVARMMLVYGYDQSSVLGEMTKIGDAAAQAGAGVAGMETLAEVIGEANMGELSNAGLERLIAMGINPYELLAQAHNQNPSNDTPVTSTEVKEMITDGLIPAQEAAQALLDMMGQNAEGAMESLSLTHEGLSSTLQGLNDNIAATAGKAYNDVIDEGLAEQIELRQGEFGDDLAEAYSQIAMAEAELVNQQARLEDSALLSLQQGKLVGDWTNVSDQSKGQLTALIADYDEATLEGNAYEAGSIMMAAQALAITEYQDSEGYQARLASEMSLVDRLQTAMAGSYYDFGYAMAQAFTKGLQSVKPAIVAATSPAQMESIAATGRYTGMTTTPTTTGNAQMDAIAATGRYTGFATGISYVPFNEFPAMLHEGERVLTASENRQYGNGSGKNPVINISGNSFNVRSDADVEAIATELMRQINLARPTVA